MINLHHFSQCIYIIDNQSYSVLKEIEISELPTRLIIVGLHIMPDKARYLRI